MDEHDGEAALDAHIDRIEAEKSRLGSEVTRLENTLAASRVETESAQREVVRLRSVLARYDETFSTIGLELMSCEADAATIINPTDEPIDVGGDD